MEPVSLIAAFLAGLLSFVSPCVLPLILILTNRLTVIARYLSPCLPTF